MSIRNAAKAIIIHKNKVLLNQCYNPALGHYFALPGGGQNPFESMEQAVVRECLEETGYTVIPETCIALYEEIYEDLDFREQHPDYAHKIFHIFKCSLADAPRRIPTEQDAWQKDSVWLNINEVPDTPLYPIRVREHFASILQSASPLFLGTVRLP